ncbi:MAG: hypothetical protein LBT23_04955 [Synergistaceae bacterium]|jgi:hypothetical protein|nr:hypothetical protein [Synergistaceae bacterium]
MISEIAKQIADTQISSASIVESGPGKFEVPGTRDLGRTNDGPTGFDAKEIGKLSDIEADMTPGGRDAVSGKDAFTRNKADVGASDVGQENTVNETQEAAPIRNKVEGSRRELEVEGELKEQYLEKEGYSVESERYLRDKDGVIVKDTETGEARRVDFTITKDGKIVDMVEVTSKTADKAEQTAKEERIRDAGGNYIKDSNGNLVEIPSNVHTKIERRD